MKWANSRVGWTRRAASCTITPSLRTPWSRKNWWSPSMRPCRTYLVKLTVEPNWEKQPRFDPALYYEEKSMFASVWSASVSRCSNLRWPLAVMWNLGDFRRNGITIKYMYMFFIGVLWDTIFSELEKEERHFLSFISVLFFLFCGDMHCESRIVLSAVIRFILYPQPALVRFSHFFADIHGWELLAAL